MLNHSRIENSYSLATKNFPTQKSNLQVAYFKKKGIEPLKSFAKKPFVMINPAMTALESKMTHT